MISVPASLVRWLLAGAAAIAVFGALLASAPDRSQADASGGYLDFPGPGVGFMQVPHDTALAPTGELTVEAWIKLRSYSGFGDDNGLNCPMLVSKNWFAAYSLALACGADATEAFINGENAQGTLKIDLNTWTHVAMTYDGLVLRTFINGQLDAVKLVDQVVGVTPDALQIGHDVEWDRTPDGSIDDVRIWSVARSQTQIESGMNNPSSTVGLRARWTFDGGSLNDSVAGVAGGLVGDVDVFVPTATPSPTPTATPTGTPTPTPTPLPSGSPVPIGAKGDIDCNARIGLADVMLFLIHLAGMSDVDENCGSVQVAGGSGIARLDLDCDGTVDENDVLHLLHYLVDITYPYPSNCTAIGGPTPALPPSGTAPGSPSFAATPTSTATPATAGVSVQVGVVAEGDDADNQFSNDELVSAGSEVTYLVTIDNDTNQSVTVTSLADNIYPFVVCETTGDANVVGTVLGADDGDGGDIDGGTDQVQCIYTANAPNQPDSVTNTVTAEVEANGGESDADSDSATISVG
jgi:hypothetical protein